MSNKVFVIWCKINGKQKVMKFKDSYFGREEMDAIKACLVAFGIRWNEEEVQAGNQRNAS